MPSLSCRCCSRKHARRNRCSSVATPGQLLMPLDLSAIQARFRHAVLSDEDAALAPLICAPAPVASRIAVYRHNVRAGLADVLATAFPVVRRIVGHGFFTALAR